MLNALLPGTVVPIHRHPNSTENVLLLHGKLVEVLYEEERPGDGIEQKQDMAIGRRLHETARIVLDPSSGSFGCVVPAGVWHTVEVLEPSVIYEAKDGKYGEDGSEAGGVWTRQRRSSGPVNLFENEITLPLWQIWDVGPRRIPYFQKIIE